MAGGAAPVTIGVRSRPGFWRLPIAVDGDLRYAGLVHVRLRHHHDHYYLLRRASGCAHESLNALLMTPPDSDGVTLRCFVRVGPDLEMANVELE